MFTLTTKIKEWLAGLALLFAAVASIFLTGRSKGVKAQQYNDTKQAAKAADVRENIEEKVDALSTPETPTQAVDTAAPGTAAGELRDDGWSN